VLIGRPRRAEKKHERTHDQHGKHQDLELVDDSDDGRLLGDHAVKRGEAGLGDRARDMSGGAEGCELLASNPRQVRDEDALHIFNRPR
jgi:hypothetical protein